MLNYNLLCDIINKNKGMSTVYWKDTSIRIFDKVTVRIHVLPYVGSSHDI